MFKNFTLIIGVLVLLAWNIVEAQSRFFHKPVTLEAKATDVDFQKHYPHHVQEPIINELGDAINFKYFEMVQPNMQELDDEMYLWRLRTKYWGKTTSLKFIKGISYRHG